MKNTILLVFYIRNLEKTVRVSVPSVHYHNLICHWHQTVWATEMVQTFSEAYRRAGFNGAHYVGVRPLKNTEKQQKPPTNIIFSVRHVHTNPY